MEPHREIQTETEGHDSEFRNALKLQFRFTQHVILQGLSDVTHEESLLRPVNGGNSINWITGHILASRAQMLALLGAMPFWSEEDSIPYARGTEHPDPIHALSLDELRTGVLTSMKKINDYLEHADLSKPDNDGKSYGERIAFFLFHESYHSGQIHLVRRTMGKPRMFG